MSITARSVERGCPVSDSLWNNNLIQFARLICEINANVDISGYHFTLLCESMDLDPDDVESLFDRAHEVWEQAKLDI
jgi:hypothetical protein